MWNYATALMLLLVPCSVVTAASSDCLGQKNGAPVVAPILIKGTPYSIEVCQLPEDSKHNFPSEIRLLNRGTPLGKYLSKSGPTGGYISEVKLEGRSQRFLALSYDAGEFCNALVFFNTSDGKVVNSLDCISDRHMCHVVSLDRGRQCETSIRCEDQGIEGDPPSQPPILKTLFLCNN